MTKKINLFANLKSDFASGLVVFLVALPLCLGIAMASGAPLFSGIIAGVVGGIVVGFLSKSHLSVSGPAAGLTAIILTGVSDLGAFNLVLTAVLIAGAIQLALGFIKAGSIANYFPSNVIEGMLAGIGLTIIIKQLRDAVGYVDPKHAEGMTDADDGFFMSGIFDAVNHIQPGAVIIAIIGILLLILWSTKSMSKFKMIPAGLVVVILGTVINMIFKAA